MKAYNIGDCIRQLREEQNVNQEDLCRGLCSKSTLSRIERGCHVPSMGTVALLLQRLGVNEDSLSFLLGTAEMEISNLHKEIEALNAQRKYDEALQKIGRMEQLTDPKDRVMQQFLLRSKALAGHLQDGQRVAYDNLAKREMLLQAIELTHPACWESTRLRPSTRLPSPTRMRATGGTPSTSTASCLSTRAAASTTPRRKSQW